MIAWLLTQQIAVLFLMVGCGVLLTKLGILQSQDGKALSQLSMNLVIPCAILNSFQIDYTDDIRNGFLLAVLSTLLIHALLFTLNALLRPVLKLDRVESASLIYSNAGNLIIPLVTAVFGPEWVIYASAYMSIQTIFIWTHGQSLLRGTSGADWKKIFTNINLITAVFGIALFLCKVRLPDIPARAVSSISAMIGPLSMIILGILLAEMDWKTVFSKKRIYLVCFLTMLAFPCAVLGLLKLTNIASLVPDGFTIVLISFLAVITPSASTLPQLALVYDQDAEYAGAINALTTLLCIFTMPLMVLLYQL